MTLLRRSMTPENRNHSTLIKLAADEENVVIEAHVANIQGALIWLLSAGSQVKILEPTALVDQIKTELQNALNNYK